jgi:mono/diheme cytochrome c family protein
MVALASTGCSDAKANSSRPLRDSGVDAGDPFDAAATPDAQPADAAPPAPIDLTQIPGTPSFAQVYAFFATHCSDCHTFEGDGNLYFGTKQDAYDGLVSQPSAGEDCKGGGRVRVVPGHPEQSLLIQKLSGSADCGARMPMDGTPIDPATIAKIAAWITAGATND